MMRRVAATSPVTLAEAAYQCRVNVGDDDTAITRLVADATGIVAEDVGLGLMIERWELTIADAEGAVALTRSPVRSLVSVTAGGAALPGFALHHGAAGSSVTGPWPVGEVAILFEVGADIDTMPGLRQAILMLAAYWYDQRTAASDAQIRTVPFAVEDLVARHRRGWIKA